MFSSETCSGDLLWSWGWKEEAIRLLKCLVLLSVQNKLLALKTVLSEMVYFKTMEFHQKERSLALQLAVKQGKPGWGLDHVQRNSFHARALALDFTLNLVKPGDGEERTDSQRLNSCLCAAERRMPCGTVWSWFSFPTEPCVLDFPVCYWVST